MAAVLLLPSYRSYSQANAGPCGKTGLELLQADKEAYQPFESVLVGGSGFAPDCQASLQLFQPDGTIVTDTVTADSQGNVAYSLPSGWMGGSYGLALFGRDGDFLAGAAYKTGSSIQADKGDYHPGETATITGRGWWPGETVTLSFDADRTTTATADAGGNFTNSDLVFGEQDLNVTFVASATGASSGLTAGTTFVDGTVFVKTFATASKAPVSSSITMTPTASVAAGHSIIIGLGGLSSFAGTIACTDTQNNSYNADFLSGAGAPRMGILSAHNVNALSTSDTITCTYPGNTSGTVMASANEFQGLAASPLDQAKGSGDSNPGFASTGNVVTTADNELLFGLFVLDHSNQTFTPTAPYSAVGSVVLGGTAAFEVPMYRTVSAAGTYSASGIITGTGFWKGAIATYKLAAACTGAAAVAGPDQTVCATTATLAASDPSPATGEWTLVTGSGAVTTPSSPTSEVTGLGVGDNIFKWTVTEGTCAPTSKTVTIHRDATPTPADAGLAQEVCGTSAALSANNPAVGQGTWSLLTGSGSFSDAHAFNATVSGLSVGANSFRWTTSNATCADSTSDVTITRDAEPSASVAGPAQEVCATSATFAANNPAVGQGTWTVVTGTGSFSDAHAYNATVSGLSVGANKFRWTIKNGVCAESASDVTITRDEQPTTANAGPNQQFCETSSTTITGNNPLVGAGKWTLVSGTGSIMSSNGPATLVTGLGYGNNTFRWTISNGTCTASTSDVTIRRDQTPTAAAAGPDQTVATSATLAANAPAVGFGTWSVSAGTGAFLNANDPATTVTGLSTTSVNTFVWTISNGTCASSSDSVNIYTDSNGDGIPDVLACDPTLFINRVVDPAGVLAAFLPPSRRHNTLQLAATAANDNDVIAMYANTTENVIIGNTSSSGGKDLRIVGCGHKITAAVTTRPVITVEVSAGANDGNTGAGEMDIQIEDVSVLKGSIGFFVQTSKGSTNATSTLLKSIRSDSNGIGVKIGATGAGNGANGNELRGANSISANTTDGVQVFGNSNVLESNRIMSNTQDGIDVTGDSNTIEANKVGEKGTGNKGNGILVAGAGNTLNENDVFANSLLGVKVTGNSNLVYKNDVGEDGKGNLGGGILITGDSNLLGKALSENDVFENTGVGIAVVGNNNAISKNDVGDSGKGNTGDGINIRGYGNVLDQNNVFANGGDGMDIAGGTAAKPNVVSNNSVGDRGKGNLGDGILVGAAADAGNGTTNPIEIDSNTVRANKLNGIEVKTAGHQLSNNVSGGTGTYASGGQDNGKCEFLISIAGNFNAGSNTANGASVTVAAAWPAGTATTCQGTP